MTKSEKAQAIAQIESLLSEANSRLWQFRESADATILLHGLANYKSQLLTLQRQVKDLEKQLKETKKIQTTD